jgi:hypothetical protein
MPNVSGTIFVVISFQGKSARVRLTRIIHGGFGFGVLGLGMGALAEAGSLAA